MMNIDVKSLLDRMNAFCTGALEGAAGLCVSRTHYEVTVEHYLSRLLEEPQSDMMLLLRHADVDVNALKWTINRDIDALRTGNSSRPVFSPLLIEWLQDAWLVSSINFQENLIRSGAMLSALISKLYRLAEGQYINMLKTVSRDALHAQYTAVCRSSIEQAAQGDVSGQEIPSSAGSSAISRFCTDFTASARHGGIDPVFGRDREILQMIDILARRRKNNPIIVGEAGVGKTAVVEGLALRIAEGDVPQLLKDVTILGLDMGLLQAGAGVKGEFENRLKSVMNEIKSSTVPMILFIDEAHTLIGAGNQAGGGDAANLLKPALARGELRTIAATTWAEYKKYFEKDAALARRFQPVKLDEPDVETTVLILRGLKDKYEAAHSVNVRDDAIFAAAELAGRYISGRQLPDKAVDLLDTSAARVKILLTAKPDVIEDLERSIQALQREKKALQRDRMHGLAIDEDRPAQIEESLKSLSDRLEKLRERWRTESEAVRKLLDARKKLYEAASDGVEEQSRKSLQGSLVAAMNELTDIQGDSPLMRVDVDPDVVAKVVSDWTGIPLGSVLRDQSRNILNLEDRLKERIKGQDEALRIICRTIKASRAGLSDPRQPIGIFLLVGPSGVGKTETGLALADLLFGGERFLTTVNMSEFQEGHTVSRLIGSPPGYVGYGEGGILTEAVRQRPYSVVLIDEVEKAHNDVVNLFYQVFDKGTLSDGEGRDIDFKNTIMFLNSNLASDVITEMWNGKKRPAMDKVTETIRPILSKHFKPALLARMTIVPYITLDPACMEEVVRLKLGQLEARLADTGKMKLCYTPDVVRQIAGRCREVETGARNIDHIMRGTLFPLLAGEILSRLGEENGPADVFLDVRGGEFDIRFD
ncbi:MAG: type VI secretion system ATPase TssH [Deltaproteobacteria bacterium HGW-Deltaproteobacteria-1]|jgi:type VI secretion system protein VasG|nr:MAG: type VI secretion system ATPase TssH [Deltaproteobacteria bacterium HGW-Deltaproteobacteria-1]